MWGVALPSPGWWVRGGIICCQLLLLGHGGWPCGAPSMGCVAGVWLSGLFQFWDWRQSVLTLTRGCRGGGGAHWGLREGMGLVWWPVYGGEGEQR